MKFVVYLVTFIVCIAILAGAAVYTVQNNDFAGFANHLEEAMKTETSVDKPATPNDDKTHTPNDDNSPIPDTNPEGDTGNVEGDEVVEGTPTPDDTKNLEEAENLKELFGILYSQYTPVSQEVQEKALKNIIESNMDISNNKSKSYLKFVDAYISALYQEISDLKGEGEVDPTSPEELEKEGNFVATEAPAYECFVDIMGGIVLEENEYKASSSQIDKAVETMIQSEVCKNTLDTVTRDAGLVSTTQKAMEHVDSAVVDEIEKALNEHLDDTELSEDVCRGLAELFGITLK